MEIFNLEWNFETKEYVLKVNTDFLDKFNISEEKLKANINYELINKLKDNIIEIVEM